MKIGIPLNKMKGKGYMNHQNNTVNPDATICEENTGKHAYTDFENSTYMVVSKIAYLIGVPKRMFENEHEPPKLEHYEALEKDKSARIVRHLSALRTAIERNYSHINSAIYYDLKNINTLPDLVPIESIEQLQKDGISIVKANYKPNQYLIDINRHLSNQINNCKRLLPLWLKWEYIRSLFIMPNGTTEEGIRRAAKEYYAQKSSYPYQVYINWPASKQGNILYNDKKFVSLLYEAHEDVFYDVSKVSDAGNIAKDGIYRFLAESERVAVVVDCENSDPYKLYAVLNNLDQKALLSKINKIILYNDIHTASAWKILEQFTDIPIEHNMIERIKENKSLVDIRLTSGTCREFYKNGIESFILVSSDSDYWGLISSMPELRFLVMVEYDKCSPRIKAALDDSGMTYCHIDDFCTGNSNAIKIAALLSELRRSLDEMLHFNVNDLLNEAYTVTRADMSQAEKKQFYDRYIKPMKIVVDATGDAKIVLGE